jgi:hypothetical protein
MTGGVIQTVSWYEWCLAHAFKVRKMALHLRQNGPCYSMLTQY